MWVGGLGGWGVCVCGGGGVAGASTLSVFTILYAVKLGTSSFKIKFG